MKNMHKFKIEIGLTISLILVGLSGCAPILIGGMAGTVSVASDRRTAGIQLEDESIELRASSRIKDVFGDRVHVNVNSFNLQVLLTGEVPNDRDRQAVAKLVSEVENVKTVLNELNIGSISTYSDRSQDLLISSKLKGLIIDNKDLVLNSFKIVTEQGNVYLMGRVTQNEANKATEIARNLSGVKKVTRVFQLLSDEELKTINAPASLSTPK
jgi:osmotically-inducible protein OsmY